MKIIKMIAVLIFVISNICIAQISQGFDSTEVKKLISVYNSYTYLELFGSDSLIIPEGFTKVYTSSPTELDNIFQVYEGNQVAILNFRGSTTKTSSWLENFYSAMIPAEGIIKIDYKDCQYKFADDPKAAVHAGYALSVVIIGPEIINQINQLNEKGIHHIYITGHSQGGALTHMVRSYLGNLPEGKISSENIFKAYSFANPMIGNEKFSEEYNTRYCDTGMSFCVHNQADPAKKMPTHFKREQNLYGSIFYKSWADYILYGKGMDMKNKVVQLFESPLKGYINASNKLLEKIIDKSCISIDLPDYVHEVNYFHVGEMHELEPFEYYEVKVDKTTMTKNEISKLKKGNDGKYYIKKSMIYQHKPYNYYVAILKKYFPEEYELLENKFYRHNN